MTPPGRTARSRVAERHRRYKALTAGQKRDLLVRHRRTLERRRKFLFERIEEMRDLDKDESTMTYDKAEFNALTFVLDNLDRLFGPEAAPTVRDALLAKLRALAESNADKELAHRNADQALLDYIGDAEITQAFREAPSGTHDA